LSVRIIPTSGRRIGIVICLQLFSPWWTADSNPTAVLIRRHAKSVLSYSVNPNRLEQIVPGRGLSCDLVCVILANPPFKLFSDQNRESTGVQRVSRRGCLVYLFRGRSYPKRVQLIEEELSASLARRYTPSHEKYSNLRSLLYQNTKDVENRQRQQPGLCRRPSRAQEKCGTSQASQTAEMHATQPERRRTTSSTRIRSVEPR
jgi:hypothetical protein